MITITPATAADAPLLADIQRQAFAPLYALYQDEGSPYLRGEEEILCWLTLPHWHVWTIHADGILCGGIAVREHAADMLYLARLYISPTHQRQGIAARAIALCELSFPPHTHWQVDFPADQPANRRCYKAAGYRDTGRREQVNERLTLAIYEHY